MSLTDDALIGELRGLAALTTGRGMHVQVSGDQLRAVLGRLDTPAVTVPPPPAPEPAWQAALSLIIRAFAEILEDPTYSDLTGVNLLDALQAWAARNHTHLDPAAVDAVNRALSGE